MQKDDLRVQLQRTLDDDYELENELQGGMSRVFVASQRSLGRRVVVKVPEARHILDQFLEQRRGGRPKAVYISMIVAGLGDIEQGVVWLERVGLGSNQ